VRFYTKIGSFETHFGRLRGNVRRSS